MVPQAGAAALGIEAKHARDIQKRDFAEFDD